MRFLRKLKTLDAFSLAGVALAVFALLWHTKISYIIPNAIYDKYYPLFKDIEVISGWISALLFSWRTLNVWIKCIVFDLIICCIFSSVSNLCGLENSIYYMISEWVFIGFTVLFVFMLVLKTIRNYAKD